eukprot:TRINITY_DN28239_c0_g1_i1.p2 TRINITY_DN28239_c0_g1~~TRINITY_DN28239_c0_g1_i1.p2  ORF type:complete len:101 (+),score=17.37 TRINITY_DN28239_c0_g1_i1:275-577(+)
MSKLVPLGVFTVQSSFIIKMSITSKHRKKSVGKSPTLSIKRIIISMGPSFESDINVNLAARLLLKFQICGFLPNLECLCHCIINLFFVKPVLLLGYLEIL